MFSNDNTKTPSISYYVTLAAIHLTGLKKHFSQVPIAYEKLRKTDVHHPHNLYFKKVHMEVIPSHNGLLTQLVPQHPSGKLVVIIHGGAYVYGPGQHHWNLAESILREHQHTVWLCDYPKAPEHSIDEMSSFLDYVYLEALKQFPGDAISLIGDSAGGGLSLALTQRIIQNGWEKPNRVIGISPVVDARFENPESTEVEKHDVILSVKGVVSAKLFCGKTDLKDPIISPLFGSFSEFPPLILFLAEYDITYPDQKLLLNKLKEENVKAEVIIGEKMPHIWPLLPFMHEAKLAKKQLLNVLK